MRCTKLTYRPDFEVLKGGFIKRLTPEKSVLNARNCSYYILDASGNLMNVMEHTVIGENSNFTLKERNIYGSSVLGLNKHEVDLLSTTSTTIIDGILGEKFYNLSNHLGNVLTTISDIKIPESSDNVSVTSYRATIVNTYDYSPFGVMLDGRTEENEFVRSGFNGMERDDELKGVGNSYDFGARLFDSRLGRWLSRDKLSSQFPGESPYIFTSNNPIIYIDFNGYFKIIITDEAIKAKGAEITTTRFEKVLNDLPKYLEQNPRVLEEIMKQTGLSKNEILQDITGDNITITIGINNLNSANAQTSSNILIDYTLIDFFETHLGKSDLENAAVNLLMADLILHEYTHVGDRKSNDGKITGQSDGDDPGPGNQNSTSAFDHRGSDVDHKILGSAELGKVRSEGKTVWRDGDYQRSEDFRYYYDAQQIQAVMKRISLQKDTSGMKNVLPMDQKN